MQTAKAVGLTILALIVVAGVVVVGYNAGWWLKEDARNRTAEIRRGGFENQDTTRAEIIDKGQELADLDAQIANPELTTDQRSALNAQREATADQLCDLAAELEGDISFEVDQYIQEEC